MSKFNEYLETAKGSFPGATNDLRKIDDAIVSIFQTSADYSDIIEERLSLIAEDIAKTINNCIYKLTKSEEKLDVFKEELSKFILK